MPWPHYDDAWTAYQDNWTTYNDVLYKMCQAHRDHATLADVTAKVGIISRAYAAGAERHTGTDDITTIARHLHRHGARVDALIDDIRGAVPADGGFTVGVARTCVARHGELCHLLSEVTREGNAIPSFTSKYLHFHVPSVPIYDQRAAWRIRQPDFYPFRGHAIRRFAVPATRDDRYYRFCNQILALWDDAVADGLPVSVRRLDQYLLYLYDIGA